MNKITIVKNENYTTVSNVPLQSKELSWKAKGLLMYLMTLPPSWKVQLSDLENRSSDGRDSTNAAIKELIEHGYISREKVTESGKFKGYDYTVTDDPKTTATGFPQRLDRNGLSATENPTLVSTKEVITKEEKKEPLPLFPTMASNESTSTVLDYLNDQTGKRYKTNTTRQKTIGARMKEGYTLADFKTVIDNKVSAWKDDPKMNAYLTPETLFAASHFDNYLNQGAAPMSTPLFGNDDASRFVDPLKDRIKLRSQS